MARVWTDAPVSGCRRQAFSRYYPANFKYLPIFCDNCATIVDTNQKGTRKHARAGWCPGDKVNAWKADVTHALLSGATDFSYQPEAFENICRPGTSECKNCAFGTGCDYDGGMHTEPRYFVSAYLIYNK